MPAALRLDRVLASRARELRGIWAAADYPLPASALPGVVVNPRFTRSLARFDGRLNTIELRPDVARWPGGRLRSVLTHELAHAAVYQRCVAEGKPFLRVVDYIGNHRVFLVKAQPLFDLPAGRQHVFNCLEKVQAGEWPLTPGCEVTYEPEAIEILKNLSPPPSQDQALRRYYEDFRELHGQRPTASEAHHDGYKPRSVRARHGSWLAFVGEMGDLPGDLGRAFEAHRPFLSALETTEMTRSFKMLVLKAMLDADELPGAMDIEPLASRVRSLAHRRPRLAEEFSGALDDPTALRTFLERNPIDAWTGGRGTGNVAYFTYERGEFRTSFAVQPHLRAFFQELTRELAQWRLDEYLDRPHADGAAGQSFVCSVSHANRSPILFLPDRARHPEVRWGGDRSGAIREGLRRRDFWSPSSNSSSPQPTLRTRAGAIGRESGRILGIPVGRRAGTAVAIGEVINQLTTRYRVSRAPAVGPGGSPECGRIQPRSTRHNGRRDHG